MLRPYKLNPTMSPFIIASGNLFFIFTIFCGSGCAKKMTKYENRKFYYEKEPRVQILYYIAVKKIFGKSFFYGFRALRKVSTAPRVL